MLTRPELIDVRDLVTVAEITTSIRGLAVEVEFDHQDVGLDQPSVINCDGLHTVNQSSLVTFVGPVDDDTMIKVCWAVSYAPRLLTYAPTRRMHGSGVAVLAAPLERCADGI